MGHFARVCYKPRELLNLHSQIKRIVKWGDGAFTGRVPETGSVDFLVVEGWAPKLLPGLSDCSDPFSCMVPCPRPAGTADK